MRVETFFSYSHTELRDDLNDWLPAQPRNVLMLIGDSDRYGHVVTVLYEPAQTGQDQGAVRVETFFHARHAGLQRDLDNWLADMPGELLAFTGGSNEHGHMLTALYKPGPVAGYEAVVLFSHEHDGLAVAATEAIEGRTIRFVVQGTNGSGHMLVFLFDASLRKKGYQ